MKSSIEEWLERLDLGKYARVFAEEEIDEEVLSELTEDDLEKLGLPLGPRKKLLKAISELQSGEAMTRAEVSSVSDPGELPGAPDAERRQLTVMFCDLVSSTELSQELDPEELREVTRAYQDACKPAIERFGGYVAKYMGDGILAYFGYPRAHEDDPDRAVRAGLAVVEAVQALDQIDIAPHSTSLAVRVGIATGPVVVGDLIGEGASQENAVVGETPNLAARLQGVAQPHEVVISSSTQSLTGGSLRFESMGEQSLKGFAIPVEAWRVTGVELGGGRFERVARAGLGRFVGRAAELQMLSDAWSRARGGKGVIVHVIGEPGIGKSRLIHEYRTQLQGPINVLEGHCMSHGGTTSFLPFIEMLRRAFGLSDEASSARLVEEMSAAINELGLNEKEHLPYLLNLLGVALPAITGVESELIGLRTRQALTAVIRAHSHRQPTILFINDCHWVDKSSEILLETIAHEEEPGSLLTLCSFRPEYHAPWDKSERVRTVPLGPLSASEVTLLFSSWFESESIGDGSIKAFFDWCGGNPLFAEELAHHLRQHGRPDWDVTAKVGEGQATSVPETLVGLLLQRVDRLSQETRHLLQAGSVMGRRFRSDVVAEVAGVSDPMTAFQEAEREDLILRDTAVQTSGYYFRHALVHDAIYSSLLIRNRRALHGVVATCLERHYRGREFEIAEELSRHFKISEDFSTAARWAAVAGDKALALFAIQNAKSWYSQALDLLSTGPEAEDSLFADVLVNQLEVYCWEIDYPGMVALAEQRLSRVEALGGTKHVSRIFSWLGEAYINSAQFPEAKMALERALAIADELLDPECIGYATAELMWLHAMTANGDDEVVMQLEPASRRVLEIAEQLDDRFLRTVVHYVMALDLAQRGYLDQACAWASQSIELGRETGYPPASSWGYCIRAYAQAWAEDYDSAVFDAREAVRVGQSKYDRLMAKMTLGSALVLQGSTADGRALLEEAKEERIGHSMIGFMYWPDMVYGLAILSSGEPDQGLKVLGDTYRRFLELGHRRAASQVRLLIGEAYADMACSEAPGPLSMGKQKFESSQTLPDAASRALESLEQAMEMGEETKMDGVVARALLGLGMLAKASGRKDEALDHLRHARKRAAPLGWPALELKIKEAIGDYTPSV